MTDRDHDPHGPLRLPDQQPVADPTDLSNQAALQNGASSRWLVPAGVLAAVAVVLYGFAFQLQLVLPIIGVVYVIAMWVAMFVVARAHRARRANNRQLAW